MPDVIPENQERTPASESDTVVSADPRFVRVTLCVAVLLTMVLLCVAYWQGQSNRSAAESSPRPLTEQSVDELLNLPRTETVCVELLTRADVDSGSLQAALSRLARLRRQTPEVTLKELAMKTPANANPDSLRNFSKLVEGDERFESMATALANATETMMSRRLGIAMQISVNRSGDALFQTAGFDTKKLEPILQALPFVHGKPIHAKLYDNVRALLFPVRQSETGEAVADDNAGRQRIQDLAISVMMELDGRQEEKARDLVRLITERRCEVSAMAGLVSLPGDTWPMQNPELLAAAVTAWIAELPTADRNSLSAQNAFELARRLLSSFPQREQKRLKQRLEELAPESLEVAAPQPQ